MDRPAPRPRRPWFLMVMSTAMGIAFCLTPVGAVAMWVLLTNPVIAGDVAASGDLWPLARAIAHALSHALASLFALL